MADSRKKVIILGYIAMILCVLAISASFAWMSISSTPTVTDLALSVVSDNGLELAPDRDGTPGAWSAILDLSEYSELEQPLTPITFSSEDNSFYAPKYGIDGRIDTAKGTRISDEKGRILSEEDANIYSYSFFIRSASSYCTVGLSEAMVRENGELGNGTFVAGEPVWNDEKVCHEEAGGGAEKVVRCALRTEDTDGSDPSWIIYEPGWEEGQETLGADGRNLAGDNRLIRQKITTWQESSPILKDTVIYKTGEFADNVSGLFSLEPGKAKKITVYMWIEGQDPDCTHANLHGGRLLANLQFNGELKNETGISPE